MNMTLTKVNALKIFKLNNLVALQVLIETPLIKMKTIQRRNFNKKVRIATDI